MKITKKNAIANGTSTVYMPIQELDKRVISYNENKYWEYTNILILPNQIFDAFVSDPTMLLGLESATGDRYTITKYYSVAYKETNLVVSQKDSNAEAYITKLAFRTLSAMDEDLIDQDRKYFISQRDADILIDFSDKTPVDDDDYGGAMPS